MPRAGERMRKPARPDDDPPEVQIPHPPHGEARAKRASNHAPQGDPNRPPHGEVRAKRASNHASARCVVRGSPCGLAPHHEEWGRVARVGLLRLEPEAVEGSAGADAGGALPIPHGEVRAKRASNHARRWSGAAWARCVVRGSPFGLAPHHEEWGAGCMGAAPAPNRATAATAAPAFPGRRADSLRRPDWPRRARSPG